MSMVVFAIDAAAFMKTMVARKGVRTFCCPRSFPCGVTPRCGGQGRDGERWTRLLLEIRCPYVPCTVRGRSEFLVYYTYLPGCCGSRVHVHVGPGAGHNLFGKRRNNSCL